MAKSSIKSPKKGSSSKKRKHETVEETTKSSYQLSSSFGEAPELTTVADDSPPSKRTRHAKEEHVAPKLHHTRGELDTSKPSAVFQPKRGRDWTLSIALPGSFLNNAKAADQKFDLPGRIARAAAVFCVDEIVVFDDDPHTIPPALLTTKKNRKLSKQDVLAAVEGKDEPFQNPDQFLYHALTYLETPGHLRTSLFGMHPNLKKAGMWPTLDMPHHMRADEWLQYREGVTLGPGQVHSRTRHGGQARAGGGTLVDCGLGAPVRIDTELGPNVRVTVKFASAEPPRNWPHLSAEQISALPVEATRPEVPREADGYYWGFTVRKAASISAVFTESPFIEDDGYDLSIGTSERGVPLSSIFPDKQTRAGTPNKLPQRFKHMMLVFGGVQGLEPAVASDPELGLSKEDAHELFDLWVNLVPGQGSRTIRTEEAVWLGLMGTRDYVASMV